MLVESEHWTGLIEDLSICCVNTPYIISCRVLKSGDWHHWETIHFTVDEEIPLPATEGQIIHRWVLPHLK